MTTLVPLASRHVADIGDLAAIVGPELWLGAAVRRWGAEHFVSESRAGFALGMSMRMAIDCDGTFAGYAALAHLRGGPVQLEFAVLPAWRGRALAQAASRELIARAGQRGIFVVESAARADNAASRAVLLRLGFNRLASRRGEPMQQAIWRWQGGVDGRRL